MVTKKGYNPTEVWPKRTGNKTGAIDAVLTVLTPPVIIKIPEGKVTHDLINYPRFIFQLIKNQLIKTRYVGQSVKLCCTGQDNGSGTLSIKWYKDGQLIKEGQKYNETSTDLKLSKLSADDAGVYMCKASNRAGIDASPKVEVKKDHYRHMFSGDLKYGPDARF